MPNLTREQRIELVLALDDRVAYLDEALHAIDQRIKTVNAILAGKLETNASVSLATMQDARTKLIAHLRTVLTCYQVLGEPPAVQASLLISELNLKES